MAERFAACNGAVVRSVDGISEGVGPEALLLRRIVDAFAEYERLVSDGGSVVRVPLV